MLNFLFNRRTIRRYTNENIAPELMTELLNAAAQASNTGNMQAYSVVVTTDISLKKQLAPAHFNQPMTTQASAVLTFCADYSRFTQWCMLRNATPGFNNFQSFMASAIDTLLFAQTFAVAAESNGLGICYLGTTTCNAQEIIEVLQLPKLVVPVTTITVGYPSDNPPITDRLPLASVVHYNTYKCFSEEEINQIYAEKEQSDFYQQYTTENNKATLAQVFTDVRYTQKDNELFSEKYLKVLKKQGFL